MGQWLKELLSESSIVSSTRFCTILCVLFAGIIGVYAIVYNRDLVGTAALVGSFLGPAFALKGYQKTVEVKENEKN